MNTCTVTVAVAEGESDYLIDEDGHITGYLGADWAKLEIPQTVNGTPVTGIAAGAFQGQTAIETVTLSAGVTSIGASAFAGCSKLRSINLEQVTNLGQSAFSQCAALTAVQLGEGLTEVPESAFSGCQQLASVTLPSTVKALDKNAFCLCTSLRSLTLPEGLTAIHAGALLGCPLQALHLPSTLEQMGDEYMGDVFEEAGQNPADTTLTHITVAENNPLYSAEDGLIYNKAQTELVFCPRGRVTAEVKEGVTAIGPYAFFMCFDLTSVTLPSTLKTVKEQAFHYCEALTDCTLPDGLEQVENSGFFGCESWTGVDNIPDSVQYIGPYAFTECKGSRLVIPEGITRIEEFAFWGYENGLTEIVLPSTLTFIGSSAFAWAKDVTSLTIPEGVTSIGEQAFGRMDSLQSLTLPSTLTEIGANAFMGGKAVENKLAEVYIPAGVTTIGANAFADRDGLTRLACLGVGLGDLHRGQLCIRSGNCVLLVAIGDIHIDAVGCGVQGIALRGLPLHEGPKARCDIVHLDDTAARSHIAADDLSVPVDVVDSAVQAPCGACGSFLEGDVSIPGHRRRVVISSGGVACHDLAAAVIGEKALAAGDAGGCQDRPLIGVILHDGCLNTLSGIFLHLGLEFRVLIGLLAQKPVVVADIGIVGIRIGEAACINVAGGVAACGLVALVIPDICLERHEQTAWDFAGVVRDIAHHPLHVGLGDGIHLAQAALGDRRLPQRIRVSTGGAFVGVAVQEGCCPIAVRIAQVHAVELASRRRGRTIGVGLTRGGQAGAPKVRIRHRRNAGARGLRRKRSRRQQRQHGQEC